MKTKLTFICAMMAFVINAYADGIIVIEGKFHNKNIYVQNSFAESGVGFCVYEIIVNGKVTSDPVNSSAFEIDLRSQLISPGTNVIVQIKHKKGCAPKVLNPDALKPAPTFETSFIKIDQEGVLKWNTKKENGSLPYIIEQFKWNKWVAVGEVQGAGSPDDNQYSYKADLTSGENRFRVKQMGNNKKTRLSEETKVFAKLPKINFEFNGNQIVFDGETHYEMYDKYGNIVKKGYGNTIDCKNLEKGIHYINYDNSTTEIQVK
jgi:hypothetical protein